MSDASRYTVTLGAQGSSRTPQAFVGATSASPWHFGPRRHLPLAVSKSQAYYWKRSWQEAEREALAEIESGQARTFASAAEVIHYLLGPDDEE